MTDATMEVGFSRERLSRHVGWLSEVPTMNPDDIQFDPSGDAVGWHKFIAFQTGIVPTECFFQGSADRVEDRTLIVVVKQEQLLAEELRVPDGGHPVVQSYEEEHGVNLDLGEIKVYAASSADKASEEEKAVAEKLFPERRAANLSKEDFEVELDKILYVPFEVKVVR